MTQKEKILNHMMEKGGITSMDAIINYGCTRLSARIADLKADGIPVKTEMVTAKDADGHSKTFAKYFIMQGVTNGN